MGFQSLGVPNFNGLLGLPVGNALFWVAPPELLLWGERLRVCMFNRYLGDHAQMVREPLLENH